MFAEYNSEIESGSICTIAVLPANDCVIEDFNEICWLPVIKYWPFFWFLSILTWTVLKSSGTRWISSMITGSGNLVKNSSGSFFARERTFISSRFA